MSYAVLLLTDLSLHALRRAEPELAGKPLAIVAGEGRKAVLTETSVETNLEPGLTVTLAMARCPGIVLRTRVPQAEVEAQRMLLAAAFTLSPRVEATSADFCTVDLQGADANRTEQALRLRMVELSQMGLPARAGIAETPLLAHMAAQRAAPLLVVPDTRGFLRDLPLAVATPSAAHADILRGWGIKTLGELTALSKADVGQRLGTEGVALWERAAGETTRVLRLCEPPKSFLADWRYEPPIEMLEPLTFKLQRYAERIALELRAAGFVAEALTLTLKLEDASDYRKEFRLPEPGADVGSWLRVILAHLESLRLPSNLTGACLKATPTRPEEKQDGLFETGLRDPVAFWENLARVSSLVGPDRVGTPVLVDTHRPDRFTLEKPAETVPPPAPAPIHPGWGMTLRRFRPPWAVQVTEQHHQPVELTGELVGKVRTVAGPWRKSGDWWTPDAWNLEIWQVEVEGTAYQLARTADGWRVEGVFD